jgi:hypothetical protein
MPAISAVSGQDLTAAALNQFLDNTRWSKSLTADITVNNTTTFSVSSVLSDLTFALVANAFYTLESFIAYDTTTTADFKFRIVLPSGANLRAASLAATTSSTTTTNPISQVVVDATTMDFVMGGGSASTGTLMAGTPCGFIRMGGTGGNLTVTFTQSTATAVNTILKRDSWIALTRAA